MALPLPTSSSRHLQTLIAQYLADNYPTALPSFLQATHIPAPDPSTRPEPDLRTLVEDYISSTLSSQLGDIELDTKRDRDEFGKGWKGWTAKDVMAHPASSITRLGQVRRSLESISAANLLAVRVEKVPYREFNTTSVE